MIKRSILPAEPHYIADDTRLLWDLPASGPAARDETRTRSLRLIDLVPGPMPARRNLHKIATPR
jgi:hypothetical protein